MGISLGYYIQCWTLQLETDAEKLEAVQRRPTKMMKGLENKILWLKTKVIYPRRKFYNYLQAYIVYYMKNVVQLYEECCPATFKRCYGQNRRTRAN